MDVTPPAGGPSDPLATPADLLTAELSTDPARPLLTVYDDATGERSELSVATTANWVAKTANLLDGGLGLGAGGLIGVLAPAHWQTAVVLLGAWSAGCAVSTTADDAARADVVVIPAGEWASAQPAGGEVFALSLNSLGTPVADLPPGIEDFALEVRPYADSYVRSGPIDPAALGLTGPRPLSLAELVGAGRSRAETLGLTRGSRVLITDEEAADRPAPLDWLLAPLSVGGSVVLVRNADPRRVGTHAAEERAQHLRPGT